jgi:hypothetical protein
VRVRFFGTVLVVVIASLLLPGTTLGWLARRLGLVEESWILVAVGSRTPERGRKGRDRPHPAALLRMTGASKLGTVVRPAKSGQGRRLSWARAIEERGTAKAADERRKWGGG